MNTSKNSGLWLGVGALAISFGIAFMSTIPGCKTLSPRPDAHFDLALDAGGVDGGNACPTGVTPKSPAADCDAKTVDDLECATCSTATDCVDYTTMVFCVATCGDPACHQNTSERKPKASSKKAAKK